MYAEPTRVRSTIHLHSAGACDWPATVRFLAARAVDGVERLDASVYRRTVRLGTSVGTLEVQPSPDGNGLSATIRLPQATERDEVSARLRRMFDLDADLPAIAAHLLKDSALAPHVSARPALRVFGGWDGFEVALRSINGQQVSVERARHLNGVLVERAGVQLPEPENGLRWVFPTPQQVLDADLAGMGMPGARVSTLKAMAEAALRDPRLFDPGRPLEDTIARLRAIRGIGDWTAHYIAMRACRQPDAFPAGDVGLLRGAADTAGRRPTAAALLARAEAWRPWRAYAAHHLWAIDSAASAEVRVQESAVTVDA